jgi:hypothetical protein
MSLFDTAIQNFYQASLGRSPPPPINTVALGLQQLSGAIRQARPGSAGENLLRTANGNFYDASLASDPADAMARMALGLQQMAAALKNML